MRLAPLNPLAPPSAGLLEITFRLISSRPALGRAKHNQGTEEGHGSILTKMAATGVSLVLLLWLGAGSCSDWVQVYPKGGLQPEGGLVCTRW